MSSEPVLDSGRSGQLAGIDSAIAQQQFQSLILSQVSDAVIAIDNDGLVTYINASAEQQYDVSADDVKGRPLSDIYAYRWMTPDAEARAAAALGENGFWLLRCYYGGDGQLEKLRSIDCRGCRISSLFEGAYLFTVLRRDPSSVRQAGADVGRGGPDP